MVVDRKTCDWDTDPRSPRNGICSCGGTRGDTSSWKAIRPICAIPSRGRFTFAPDVGLHEDDRERDSSSLSAKVIVTRNMSASKIRCECHAGREDVPVIDCWICDEQGYLPDVLKNWLIEDRDQIRAEVRGTENEERRDRVSRPIERDQVDSSVMFRLSRIFEHEVRTDPVRRGGGGHIHQGDYIRDESSSGRNGSQIVHGIIKKIACQ